MAKYLSKGFAKVAKPARDQMPSKLGRYMTRKTYVAKIQEQAALDKHSPLGKLTVKRNAIARAVGAHEHGLTTAVKKSSFGGYVYKAGEVKKIGRYIRQPGLIVKDYEASLSAEEKAAEEQMDEDQEAEGKNPTEHDETVAKRVARRERSFRKPYNRDEVDVKNSRVRRDVSIAQALTDRGNSTDAATGPAVSAHDMPHHGPDPDRSADDMPTIYDGPVITVPEAVDLS